ncbi:MAG: NYN domain-containing protein [Betaproteobacteria bacterium]|nr:NYN domain-containing protein [Betaproteobacteria bacterium]
MDKTAVFLDAGYVDKVLYYDHGNARVDYGMLAQEMVAPNELFRTYYYHCMPYQSNPPTEEEKTRYANKHRFITALGRLPRFEVRLGRLAKVGVNVDGKSIYVQKRVDCMLGVDMALLAGKRMISNVVLFSGDSDFIPAIEAVKREGIIVTLWHGGATADTHASRDLIQCCDERKMLEPSTVEKITRQF